MKIHILFSSSVELFQGKVTSPFWEKNQHLWLPRRLTRGQCIKCQKTADCFGRLFSVYTESANTNIFKCPSTLVLVESS